MPPPLPSVLKDSLRAIQVLATHAQKAADANGELLELALELRDRDSELSQAERTATQQRIDALRERMRREGKPQSAPLKS